MAARQGEWGQPLLSSDRHAAVPDNNFEGAAAAAAWRSKHWKRCTSFPERLGGAERSEVRRSGLRQDREDPNRGAGMEAGKQLAASQVALMREVQSQLQPVVPSWLGDPKTNCCSNAWDGLLCNGKGEVVSIYLPGDYVGVPFPTSLGGLASLTNLTIGGVVKDARLGTVSTIIFNTSIPSELGRLTNLRVLSLWDCFSLTTQLQDLSWLSSLQGLRRLDLSRMGMQGAFSENVFLHLTRLTHVNLYGNNVTVLPSGIEALNVSLVDLTISRSNLYGALPPRLFALSRLTSLDLSYNRLQGNLSDMGFPFLSSLRNLILKHNEFTGSIPETISRLKGLASIVLSYNRLSGPIPSEVFSLPQLQSLYASRNQFTSPFPTTIGASFASLQYLDLTTNNFSGPLPPSIGLFKNLVRLSLMYNKFSGVLPDAWSALAVLKEMDVIENRLEGSPVELLVSLPNLIQVSLSHNRFSGELVDKRLSKIVALSIKSNRFTGAFPLDVLPRNGFLLDISGNRFSGKIPEQLAEWSGQCLWLGSNNFSGPLPVSLSRMTNLVQLNVSRNQLNGSIPSQLISGLTRLEMVDLSHNEFSGQLPSFPSKNLVLAHFDASHNHFSGSFSGNLFPPFQPGRDYGGFLDLSYNALSGNVSAPNSTVAGLRGLTALHLHRNLFAGGVPSSICSMTDLKVLSLSHNLLSGELPDCLFLRPESLQGLDLSNNVLFGKLQNFVQVNSTLSLANNYFTVGSTDITARDVQSCDLDNNCLTLANTSLPADGYGEACVVKGKQRTARQCGEFCGTVGDTQCGGQGVCQTSPAFWAAYEQRIRYLSGGGRPANSSVEAMRELFRASLLRGTTCQCNQNFSLQGAPNGTVTCKLVSSPSVESSPSPAQNNFSTGAIVGISIAAITCAVAIGVLLFLLLQPKKQRKWSDLDVCRQFSAAEIARATDGWSADNLLGEGGFGSVYRGVNRDGEVWAVKRAKLMSNDFETEVRAMASLHHPRLVRLLGFCEDLNETTGHHEQILVYEFVPGGDLKGWMHGSKGKQFPLSMAQRLDTVAGMADGLAYLHSFDPPIVHRDIKPANVLIDENMQPKIADFGFLKQLFDVNDATRVAGTPGYVDPDYNRSSMVSVGSDVYSLGIVMLELLTGKNSVSSDEHVLLWAKPVFEQGDAKVLCDPAMVAPDEAVLEFCLLAMDCTRCPAMFRPSMKDVMTRALAIKAKYAGRIEEVRTQDVVWTESQAASMDIIGERSSSSGAGTNGTSAFSSELC